MSADMSEWTTAVDLVTTPVLREIVEERARQDAKWGEQNHPDVAPEAVDEDATLASVFAHYELPFVADVKAYVDRAAERGQSSWVGIALEELTEVLEAAALLDGTKRSEDRVRTEVVQLAAVCVQWVQAIDRRGGPEAASNRALAKLREALSDDSRLAHDIRDGRLPLRQPQSGDRP